MSFIFKSIAQLSAVAELLLIEYAGRFENWRNNGFYVLLSLNAPQRCINFSSYMRKELLFMTLERFYRIFWNSHQLIP